MNTRPSSSSSNTEREAAFQRTLQRHEERTLREATLYCASAEMARCGVSQPTIATALRGLHLFLETTGRTSLELTPTAHQQETFSLLRTIEPAESPGLLLSDIPTRPIEWLWPQRIPLGALTLLEGCPGSGTSLLALSLAAIVSAGQSFPDGPRCPQGRVILVCPHDDAGSTIKPRLLAAGGDPSQVLWLPAIEHFDAHHSRITDRPFSPALDLDRLEEAMARQEPLLVIIDALDTLTARQRATILPQLAALAHSFGSAILLLHAARPSAAFSAGRLAAGGVSPALLHLIRSALRIVPASSDDDEDELQQFLLVCTKHSLDAGPTDLAFEITSDYLSPEAAALASTPSFVSATSETEPAFFSGLCVPVLLWREDLAASSSGLHSAVPLSRLRQVLLQALQASPQPLSPKALATLTGEGYAAVRQTLRRMCDAGELFSPARGLYTTPDRAHSPTAQPHDSSNPPSQPSQSSPPIFQPSPSSNPATPVSSPNVLISPNSTEQVSQPAAPPSSDPPPPSQDDSSDDLFPSAIIPPAPLDWPFSRFS